MTKEKEATIGDIPATEWIGKRVKVPAKTGGGGRKRAKHGLLVRVNSVKGNIVHFTSPYGADSIDVRHVGPNWSNNPEMVQRRQEILKQKTPPSEVEDYWSWTEKSLMDDAAPPAEVPVAAVEITTPPVAQPVTYRASLQGRGTIEYTIEELIDADARGLELTVRYDGMWQPVGQVLATIFPESPQVIAATAPKSKPAPPVPKPTALLAPTPKPTMQLPVELPEVTITLKAGADTDAFRYLAEWHGLRRDVAEAEALLQEARLRFDVVNGKLVAGGVIVHDPLPRKPEVRPVGGQNGRRDAGKAACAQLFQRIVTNKERVKFVELQEYNGFASKVSTRVQLDKLRQGLEEADPEQRMWAVSLECTAEGDTIGSRYVVAQPVEDAP